MIQRERKKIRLETWDYSWNGFYFVTICIKNRYGYFGDIKNGEMHLSDVGRIAEKFWQEIPDHFSESKLGEFVIMPNHLHGIVIINRDRLVDELFGIDDVNSQIMWEINMNVDPNHVGAAYMRPLHGSDRVRCDDSVEFTPSEKRSKMTLSKIIHGFKSSITRKVRQAENIDNDTKESFGWQRSFYDSIVRDNEMLFKIRSYIRNNPRNWEQDCFFNHIIPRELAPGFPQGRV